MSYEATLLIVNETAQILARREGSAILLPKVNVEQGRAGISLTRAAREQMQLEVFLLIPAGGSDLPWHVMRLQHEDQPLPIGHFWASPSDVLEKAPSEAHVRGYSCSEDNEIGRYGWYSEVESWLASQIAALGFTVRLLEQWNGRVGGVLLRVATDGPQFWFKAVTDFNQREIWIAQTLAERHPDHFPHVLVTEPRWNAFLLEHVEGIELNESEDLSVWKRTAGILADIQIDWVGEVDQLLRAGAADLRPASLVARIPDFIDVMDFKMASKTIRPQAQLKRVELEKLGAFLCSLCADVATLPFSCGLANADFSPHNTLIIDRGPVFIDWAESCISFPLITGEYLWNRMVVESPERAPWQDALRIAYFDRWTHAYGPEVMSYATRLLPAFAIYAVTIFYLEGKGSGGAYDDYLCSLTRRLNRIANRTSVNLYAI